MISIANAKVNRFFFPGNIEKRRDLNKVFSLPASFIKTFHRWNSKVFKPSRHFMIPCINKTGDVVFFQTVKNVQLCIFRNYLQIKRTIFFRVVNHYAVHQDYRTIHFYSVEQGNYRCKSSCSSDSKKQTVFYQVVYSAFVFVRELSVIIQKRTV